MTRENYDYQNYARVPGILARTSLIGSQLNPEQRRLALDGLNRRNIAEVAFKTAVYAGVPAMLYASVAMARAAGF